MSTWTDEQLTELLRDVFAEREARADPETARRIARDTEPVRRNPWPVAVAGAAILLVLVGISVLRSDKQAEPPLRPPPSPRAVQPVPLGYNRTQAMAVAARIFERVPVPPGARRRTEPLSPRLRERGAFIGYIDPSLSRTGFWVVPMSHVDLVRWYADHTPADTADATGNGSTTPEPDGVMFWAAGKDRAAYTQPEVIVGYARLGSELTALRIDVTLAARDDRTAETLVPVEDLESVTITPHTVFRGEQPPPPVRVTDPTRLQALGEAFNRARGAASRALPAPCSSPTGDYLEYAVKFRWPGHALEATTGSQLCRIGRDVILDGMTLPQRIGADTRLDDLLDTVARGR